MIKSILDLMEKNRKIPLMISIFSFVISLIGLIISLLM